MILPSGAELVITVSPFAISKALYQAILEETGGLKITAQTDLDANFIKDLFCTGFSSKRIEACIHECMKRCTYNGKRIDKVDDIFEPIEARDDYLTACFEVAKENVLPFTKSLYAKYSHIWGMLKGSPA